MAFKNKTITNSKTGQDIKFIPTGNDTNGQLVEMEATYNSQSKEPTSHYHPLQAEDFTILSGQLTVWIDKTKYFFVKTCNILNLNNKHQHTTRIINLCPDS